MFEFENEMAACMECTWEGRADELKIVMKENEVNIEDKSLYEIPCCPKCGSEFIEVS